MEDDDEIHSHHHSPIPNGRISVTVAAPPPPANTLTLALPIQQQQQKTLGSSGGREDCWSEGATAVLIDAWGERYMELSRGNLKQKHWKDVADVVSSRDDYTKTPKTDIQCKNRIDTVKKKYKTEKAKIASGGGPSNWRFFGKLDELIGHVATQQSDGSNNMYQRVPMGIPVGVRSAAVNVRVGKRPPVDSDEESEQENSADSSDGLPPESYKRPRFQRETMMGNIANATTSRHGTVNNKSGGSRIGNKESSWGNSMRELTRAVLKFGEAYEQAEMGKLQQLVDMEKQRMKFAKDLELQRMQFFMKTQMEISQLKNRKPANNNNHRGVENNNGIHDNNNDNNDSDSN
ncbi:hypothetical protein RD792_005604 [Penstemon davidsonii]|uniref:Myb/SANT-like DNA-binding domain-containing protein n=1 Tax=Penstemon davidsonii TaxID=160366 RepID=A0ABR0DG54_9LAMI|nr:hypothetical protein RD792_005604 [Penstemon davidsonii]